MTRVLKAVGTQWRFVSNHDTVTHLTERVVEITADDAYPWDYTVRLVEGTPDEMKGSFVVVDRELVAIASEVAA